MKKLIIFLIVFLSAGWAGSAADAAIIVGRISHVEGDIYRYMDVDDRWVETHLQSPAGIEDVLATGDNSRAEIAFPNNLLLRLDENTAIEILALDDDLGAFVLNSGLARFYNRSGSGRFAIETAMGTAKVAPGSVIDVQVDGNSVVVSAVHGEATFQSLDNGVEKLEVISGSTSLEFNAESIVAGVGPIDMKWDRWCADKEGIWAQNRLVRSEYLPETMQEYAYVLKPYGSWRRIYYRGYNYWVWQPRYVAAGWAPYTTGYWYDWQGEPAWIDHNPWGWVTHHHGHWIHMQGVWMWTPYVHVSFVPGVTVVGLNITFGKTYRPYWHPGRVRWIAHNDYVGWLPLAPWETYYGYRQWGPRTVVMRGGASFSINISLSSHKHIKHAVIIPKRYFHQRGPVGINNYNTVKVKNINKTIIVKNYKALPTVEEQRHRKHATKGTRAGKTENRVVSPPERRTVKQREVVRIEKYTRKDDPANQAQKKGQKEKMFYNSRQTFTKEETGAIEKRRDIAGTAKKLKSVVISEQRIHVRKSEKQQKTAPGRSVAARNEPQRSNGVEAKNREKKESRQAAAQTSNRSSTSQGNKTAAVRQNSREDRKQVQQKTRAAQRQVQQNEKRGIRKYKENSTKYGENEKREEAKQEKQIARVQQYSGPQNISRERRGVRQKTDRDFVSASFNNRRFR